MANALLKLNLLPLADLTKHKHTLAIVGCFKIEPPGVVVDAASVASSFSNSFHRSSFSVYISFWLSFAITSTMCTYEPVALGRIQLRALSLSPRLPRFLSLVLHARHFIPYSLSNTLSNYHTNSRDTYLFFFF